MRIHVWNQNTIRAGCVADADAPDGDTFVWEGDRSELLELAQQYQLIGEREGGSNGLFKAKVGRSIENRLQV